MLLARQITWISWPEHTKRILTLQQAKMLKHNNL
jgi:hypothetical protein